MMSLIRIQLRDETDIVHCRQRARQIAHLLQLDSLQQTQVATAVSEVARNALIFAGGGSVHFGVSDRLPSMMMITVDDKGPGIADLDEAIAQSRGMGLKGCKRLMDVCEIATELGKGTTVSLAKILNLSAVLSSIEVAAIVNKLMQMRPSDAMSEVRLQNTELLVSLEEIKKQQDVALGYQRLLEELNKELADTNRGVIALNIELEEQANTVREASEIKARFLSHVTHEFRTPVNSILSMSRILLGSGAHLDEDQRKQIGFMRQAAEGLSDMVNDLLDTVKAEAGKLEVTNAEVSLSEIFDTLRGTFRPLMPSDRKVELIIDESESIPHFISDETKLSQILRNFVSNALKFTDHGSIQVRARLLNPEQLEISVIDSGIGIAPEHQGMIFEEFMQVRGAHQKRAKGTGLGLPLARRLARLLGGEIFVESQYGSGSTFSLKLPFHQAQLANEGGRKRILMIDDDEASHYNLRDLLMGHDFDLAFALTGKDGLSQAESFHPDLIILDVRMPGMDGFEVLKYLKSNAKSRAIPVLLNSSMRFSMDDFPLAEPRPDGILLKDNLSQGVGMQSILRALKREERGATL